MFRDYLITDHQHTRYYSGSHHRRDERRVSLALPSYNSVCTIRSCVSSKFHGFDSWTLWSESSDPSHQLQQYTNPAWGSSNQNRLCRVHYEMTVTILINVLILDSLNVNSGILVWSMLFLSYVPPHSCAIWLYHSWAAYVTSPPNLAWIFVILHCYINDPWRVVIGVCCLV